MATGTIERFNYMKGFGYILPDAGGPHIFFYADEANRSGRFKILEGEKLEFETATDRGGVTRAVNLKFEQEERSERIARQFRRPPSP